MAEVMKLKADKTTECELVTSVLTRISLGQDIELIDHSRGQTFLHYVTTQGYLECCKVLIDGGANINHFDHQQTTPLMIAARQNHCDIVKLFVKAKCNLDLQSVFNRTALHYVCLTGCETCAATLLSAGASVDVPDSSNCTPLKLAVDYGHYMVVRLLLDYEADVWCRTAGGDSLLHVAASRGSKECCDLLIVHGLDINVRRDDRKTTLITALEAYQMNCALHLVKLGCHVGKELCDDTAPLVEAVYRDAPKRLIYKMLKRGADPNATNRFHTLPLWYAVDVCDHKLVKLLMEVNSSITRQTESMMFSCAPCSPVVHALHTQDPVLIAWMIQAYAHEAATIMRAEAICPGRVSNNIVKFVRKLTNSPQPLVRLCRQAVRKQLGSGYAIYKKIDSLGLPSLLCKYLRLNDLNADDVDFAV